MAPAAHVGVERGDFGNDVHGASGDGANILPQCAHAAAPPAAALQSAPVPQCHDVRRFPIYDLLVIGGGINGAGIARDAAGRGLSVLLAEQDDLAAHTSSWSTKLIHGGLRYLEYYEFRLVSESLTEREVLLANAPHIIEPLAFVLPHEAHLRPAWMIRIGLFLYDHLGGRMTLPKSFGVKLAGSRWGAGLQAAVHARLRLRRCARRRCAAGRASTRSTRRRRARDIRVRTRVTGARREGGLWRATLQAADGATTEVSGAGDRQRRRPVGEARARQRQRGADEGATCAT